jgi:hypothetical protein
MSVVCPNGSLTIEPSTRDTSEQRSRTEAGSFATLAGAREPYVRSGVVVNWGGPHSGAQRAGLELRMTRPGRLSQELGSSTSVAFVFVEFDSRWRA